MGKYVVALDQGTTSSRALVFDKNQNIVSAAQKEFQQYYPQEGWVEHDPMEIFSSQYSVLMECVLNAGITPSEIVALGITNQRETTIVWDRETGKPIYNAIVWQCRRTAEICEQLRRDGLEEYIRENTGLLIDAYFSATKLKWILDTVPHARERAQRGELLFGTVDSWLLYKLTDGKVHMTDYTNASRTMMFNIHTLQWDKKILNALDIPETMLPKVACSSEVFGYTNFSGTLIPITGIAGDQQAALFGQTCFTQGEIKNTYGTGCFMLLNCGEIPVLSKSGLITTIAASLKDQKPQYVLEGSVFIGGAVIQWLRDEMGLLDQSLDSHYFAEKAADNGGVYLVPAFTGLGAPYWEMYARGTITGITRGTGKNHIIRAALESIAYQSADLMEAMKKDANFDVAQLKVDGGASSNDFLMQFQADILNLPVCRPKVQETTALGAASLAGLGVGFWRDQNELKKRWEDDKLFLPTMPNRDRKRYLSGWSKAMKTAIFEASLTKDESE